MNNKKFIWSVVVILAVLGVVGWRLIPQTSTPQQQSEVVQGLTLGALLPLTGGFAFYGEDARNGLLLAEEDFEKQTTKNVNIIVEDNASDAKVAVQAANKLLNVDKVATVFATAGSAANLAVAPLMEASQTSFLAVSSTPKLNDAGKYVFKLHPDVDKEAQRSAQYIFSKGLKAAAVIYDQSSDTSTIAQKEFTALFQKLGGTVVAEGFDGKTATDLRAVIGKAVATGPGAIYMVSTDRLGGLLAKQVRELGLRQIVVGFSAWDTPAFFDAATSAAEGVIITAQPFGCQGTAIMQEFCKRYQTRFSGKLPTQYAADAYDSFAMVVRAAQDNNLFTNGNNSVANRGTLNTALNAVKEHNGVSGRTLLDDQGNARDKDFVFRVVKDGKFVEITN